MASIVLPPAFPIVGLGIAAAAVLNVGSPFRVLIVRHQAEPNQAWQQIKVVQIRGKAGVKYPTLYVTEAEADADPIKMVSAKGLYSRDFTN